MKDIVIIECPSNLGLKELNPGHEPGVRKLPEWLHKHSFHDFIKPSRVYKLDPPPYTMNIDEASGIRNADAIIEYAKEQETLLQKLIAENKFALVIGGDCSLLVGNALGLKKSGNYGIFYLDGHTDFITPELSGTAGAAGMDLAIIAGLGPGKLTNIDNQKPYIKEEHIYCVGNREYDEEYERPVKDSAVTYLDLNSLRKAGLSNSVNNFLQMVAEKKLDGFFIHFDVDVLDDDVMPAVDSRTPGGLTYDELTEILQPLLAAPKAIGIEITILDPELDTSGKYTNAFIDNFCNIINRNRDMHDLDV